MPLPRPTTCRTRKRMYDGISDVLDGIKRRRMGRGGSASVVWKSAEIKIPQQRQVPRRAQPRPCWPQAGTAGLVLPYRAWLGHPRKQGRSTSAARTPLEQYHRIKWAEVLDLAADSARTRPLCRSRGVPPTTWPGGSRPRGRVRLRPCRVPGAVGAAAGRRRRRTPGAVLQGPRSPRRRAPGGAHRHRLHRARLLKQIARGRTRRAGSGLFGVLVRQHEDARSLVSSGWSHSHQGNAVHRSNGHPDRDSPPTQRQVKLGQPCTNTYLTEKRESEGAQRQSSRCSSQAGHEVDAQRLRVIATVLSSGPTISALRRLRNKGTPESNQTGTMLCTSHDGANRL